ncbi:MAG: hypothetical protein M1G31_04840 [Pseudanabaena sp. Salubria-1]|nr:hypothetical protein [Pseudanabaena sp. Salubria-1]
MNSKPISLTQIPEGYFVQEVLAQLPTSIEAIVQQAAGQLPSIEEIVQQPVAQLPNIEDIRRSSRSLKIYSQVHSSFKQILGLSTQELIRKSSIHKNILL